MTTLPDMGQYQDNRLWKLVQHNSELRQQVQDDEQRRARELVHEKELDRLRADCAEMEKRRAQTQQAERLRLLREAGQEGLRMLQDKQETQRQETETDRSRAKEVRKDSEAKYRNYMESYAKQQTAMRTQLARQLEEQITEKGASGRKKSAAVSHCGVDYAMTRRRPEVSTCQSCNRALRSPRYLSSNQNY